MASVLFPKSTELIYRLEPGTYTSKYLEERFKLTDTAIKSIMLRYGATILKESRKNLFVWPGFKSK